MRVFQNINQGRAQDVGGRNDGLVASPHTGSTNDAVLLFDAANQSIEGPGAYVSITNSATLGTSITLLKPGVYSIEFGVGILAAASGLVLGISQDATNLTGNLLVTDTGALLATSAITNASNLGSKVLATEAFVDPEQETSGTVIRFHASASNGAPTAMLDAAACYYRIKWSATNSAQTTRSVAPITSTSTLIIDSARWSEAPHDFEDGNAGSTWRSQILEAGDDDYLFWLADADTPSGVVQTGIDPGDFEPSLAGMTGHAVPLPVDTSTPEEHAALIATTLLTVSGITAAVPAVSAEDNGSWSILVTHPTGFALTPGTRSHASAGAKGLFGGHIYRVPVAGEATGSSDIPITRPIANRITTPPSTARIYGVQMEFTDTVSTASSARPRVQLWAGTGTTSPGDGGNSELIFDFGQFPASQIVAGNPATIFLTPAQVIALRTAIDGATGTNFWLSAHAVTGTNYVAAAVGSGLEGEAFDANVVVNGVASNDPTAVITDWVISGESNFAFLTGIRLLYEVDPATTGEHRANWGSVATFAQYPDNVTLPDTITGQRGGDDLDIGLQGGIVFSMSLGVVTGQMRVELGVGGTIDLDNPSQIGSTTLWAAGQTTVSPGDFTVLAPTGAGTIRVPAGMWMRFKGTGAEGRGDLGPGPWPATARVDQPCTFIRESGVNRGENRGETDIGRTAGGYGDDTTPFESPITDPDTTEFLPGNNPYLVVVVRQPPMTVT